MNILIFSANWYNRGDEAAIRAMIDEIKILLPECKIRIHFNHDVSMIPYSDIDILKPFRRCDGKNIFKTVMYQIAKRTNGAVPYIGKTSENFRCFIEAVQWADYAIYAPGGPCIGDFYNVRRVILDMIEILIRNRVPFSLFAPSLGPFNNDRERVAKLLNRAEVICFRESISQGYFSKICPRKKTTVTLDSAFQHPIDCEQNKKLLDVYPELKEFLSGNKKIIGVTITDLMWHRNYKNTELKKKIDQTFKDFIEYLDIKGYSVIFIPQLFGENGDKKYMSSFARKNSFVMSDEFDSYFQQYIISKLYAVVGMRYHSNIFSAKMGIPFVSVAYEQKMEGFMNNAGLEEYCIQVGQLSFEKLRSAFDNMIANYDLYKEVLKEKRVEFQKKSYMTTSIIVDDIIDKVGQEK